MRRPSLLISALLATSAAVAQPLPSSQSPAAETPLAALPYTPSLDTQAMDRSVDPCEDLYQFACGHWNKDNPIPADQSRWSVYAKMANENQRYLWGILDKLSQGGPERTPNQVKMGDYFASCMSEDAARAQGLAPLQPLLTSIDALADKRELPALLAVLHLATNNERLFFRFASGQDFADSSRLIAFATAGGLSLPDRDYYLGQDAKSKKIRAQFEAHVARLLELGGATAAAARAQARTVLKIETALACASLSKVDKRDPYKSFHVVNAQGLQALTPGFDWAAYQQALGAPSGLTRFNVTEPAFMKAFAAQLKALPLADLKSYLRWQALSSHAALLSPEMVQANFDFFGHTLNGVPQLKARWKRCVELVDLQMGEALGQEFVTRNFSPALKDATLKMTAQIETAMAARIEKLEWMSPATRKQAQEKLHAIVNKVGYPDRWRDYRSLPVARGAFVANVQAGHAFELRRQLAKIGQPLDRGEWGMTPQTVNAYYDAQMNDINFPAGVLQPPLYDAKLDDAPNYGNTGGTIGHELVLASNPTQANIRKFV